MAHSFLQDLAAGVRRRWRDGNTASGEASRQFDVLVAEYGRARAVQPRPPAAVPAPRMPEQPADLQRRETTDR